MGRAWTIGGSPQRTAGVVCHHPTCGSRDAVTNLCGSDLGLNCRDRKEKILPANHTNEHEKESRTGLQDLDPMPWGKYKNTLMQDVPADYMFWLWTKRGFENNRADPVADYIRRNLSAFEMEYPDGIWR